MGQIFVALSTGINVGLAASLGGAVKHPLST